MSDSYIEYKLFIAQYSGFVKLFILHIDYESLADDHAFIMLIKALYLNPYKNRLTLGAKKFPLNNILKL